MKKQLAFEESVNQALQCRVKGDYKESIKLFKGLIIKYPNEYIVPILLAETYYLDDQYEIAVPLFQKAFELKPNSEALASALFHCLNGSNRADEAMVGLMRFLNMKENLTRDNCKWILQDLVEDINNPLIKPFENEINGFITKFKIDIE